MGKSCEKKELDADSILQTILYQVCMCHVGLSSPGSRNLLWGGGGFTRGAAMYAKLFERGGGGGGGGAVGKLN